MATINELKTKVEPVQVDFWWGKTNPEETYTILTDTFPYSHQKDNVNRGNDSRYNIPTTPIKTAMEFNAVGTTKEINPIFNPSFEYDIEGKEPEYWSRTLGTEVTGEAFGVTKGWSSSGSQSLHVKAKHPANTTTLNVEVRLDTSAVRIPIVEGKAWTLQVDLDIISAAPQGFSVLFDWYKADNVTRVSDPQSAKFFSGETGTKTLTVSQVAPAEAAFLGFIIRAESNVSGGTYDFYMDSVIAAEGEHTSLTYFDGDTLGYKWTGVPGKSTSESTPPKVVTPTGVSILQYLWNFGDGTTGYGPQAKHTYLIAQPSVIASLIVQDSRGLYWARGHHIHLK